MARGSTTSNVGTKGVRVTVGLIIGGPAPTKVGVKVKVGSGCVGAIVGVSLGTVVSVGTASEVEVVESSNSNTSGKAEQAASIHERVTIRIFFDNVGFIYTGLSFRESSNKLYMHKPRPFMTIMKQFIFFKTFNGYSRI
jgi:hypothetical protein